MTGADARAIVWFRIVQRAAAAQAEIGGMADRARRRLGQQVRRHGEALRRFHETGRA